MRRAADVDTRRHARYLGKVRESLPRLERFINRFALRGQERIEHRRIHGKPLRVSPRSQTLFGNACPRNSVSRRGRGLETKFREVRSQTEFGNEVLRPITSHTLR